MAERTIFITEYDAKRLREVLREARAGEYRGSEYVRNLQAEVERAKIVPSKEIPPDVITMNSTVVLLDVEADEDIELTLVYPQDASRAEEKVSILAPIGTAILGYRTGDTIQWKVPDGVRKLKVKKILYQPEASGDFEL